MTDESFCGRNLGLNQILPKSLWWKSKNGGINRLKGSLKGSAEMIHVGGNGTYPIEKWANEFEKNNSKMQLNNYFDYPLVISVGNSMNHCK